MDNEHGAVDVLEGDERAVERLRGRGRPLAGGAGTSPIRGVTYGTFRRRPDGARFPDDWRLDRDFAAISSLGLNTVRVYTIPPADLLEAARRHSLRLIVGLDYEDWRMVDGSDRRATARVLSAGLGAVDRAMELCSGRPEVLAVSVGNEVPVGLVRLHGVHRVERALERLIDAVHRADPAMLATYTNYPSTEFLDPGGQDLASWNVFLEDRSSFSRYLTHLLVLAGTRPLVLSEFGLPAGIHGEHAQAEAIGWQIGELVDSGAAGGTVFSWTDEWAVADVEVDGWHFGVTRADRTPKPAAAALGSWPSRLSITAPAPRVGVIVCAYNEAANIEACIESVLASAYPNLELIVCDDGSDDATATLAGTYPVELLRLERGGLSAARNAGMRAASGDIVAYLDADAEAGPHWVEQLVSGFDSPTVAAVGGPNHPYEEAGLVERAVAASPGNPREVLLGDTRAEHIAGCNMAFRRRVLLDAGGFDVAYRTAGDDVDLCWRLLDQGHEIGFAPAAAIRHHRRATVRGYLRQQRGYGRAERMLQGPHRARFNRIGQARWRGVVYGGTALPRRLLGSVVYHGPLGVEPFQPTRVRRGEAAFATLLALLPPLSVAAGITVLAAAATGSIRLAAIGVAGAVLPWSALSGTALVKARVPAGVSHPARFRAVVALLHVLQPHARFWGRLRTRPLRSPGPQAPVWSGDRLAFIDQVAGAAQRSRWQVRYAGETDAHDLAARRRFTTAKLNLAVVWDWTPQWAIRVRPRRSAAVAGTAGVLVAGAAAPRLLLAAAASAVLVAAGDLAWSQRALRIQVARIAARSEVVDGGSAAPETTAVPAALPVEA